MSEDFDPRGLGYSTFRWITTDQGFAMGPSRANPLTGEILDADIIFDANMIRFFVAGDYHSWRCGRRADYSGERPASMIEGTRRGWAWATCLPQNCPAIHWLEPTRREGP